MKYTAAELLQALHLLRDLNASGKRTLPEHVPTGFVKPRWRPLILRKPAAYPRQNSLALALRELGKLERTFLTLQWLQDPELRRRSHVGLNNGEQQNALRRAVFFNRLGEIRDRSYENEIHRASGLNLLVAAIILWNTTYLQRAVDHLRNQGHHPATGDLVHLSPLGWEHINLTGDYH